MKRLWFRFRTPRWMSVIWLCNAFAVLVITLSPLFTFAPANARPAPPGPDPGNVPGGGSISATFLDSSHIGIEASGNITFSYHDTYGNAYTVTTSLFPLQGVYYGAISQYPSWGTGYGGTQPNPGVNYWFANNQTNPGGNVCSGHNSNIQITGYDPATGNATGNFYMRIPVVNNSGSTSTTPTCQPIGNYPDGNGYELQNIPILNVGTGGSGLMKSFSVASTVQACQTQCMNSTQYSTLNLPYVAGSANFYKNDSNDIYASIYDPSIGAHGGNGWDAMYEFTSPVTNSDGSTTYHQGTAGYVNGSCPDTLTIPKDTTGIFIQATYSVWQTGSTTCGSTNPAKPVTTYPVLVLMQTPAAYLASLTGQASATGTGSGGAGGASTSQLVDCTAGAGSGFFTSVLNWILCGAINLALGTANLVQGWINGALQIDITTTFGTGSGYYAVWVSFRDIAIGMFVIGALILLAARAFGVEILGAQDERKLLARFPIAIILMTISWQGLAWIYGLDNKVQTDLPNILYSGFAGTSATVGPGANLFASLGAAATVFTLGPATLTLLLTALVALGAGLLGVLIRDGLLTILAATVCVPIAAWAIPIEALQKLPKMVKDEGIGLLLVGPAIGLLFPIFQELGATEVKQGGTLGEFLGILLYVAPGFLILGLIQQAGRLTGMATGMIQKGQQGIQGRLSAVRQRAAETNLKKAGNYSRFSDNTALGRGLNTVTGAAFHPWRDARRGKAGIQQGRQAGRAAHGAETLKNDAVFNANSHDDAFLYALAAGEEKTRAKIAEKRIEGDEFGAMMLEEGLATAAGVKDHKSAGVRAAAFGALTQTGYQIKADKEGYAEMSEIATDITGGTATSGDRSAYTRLMDTGQFNMNQAGRFDVGAPNHAAGYDRDKGLDKTSTYTAGQAKKETVASFQRAIEEHVTSGQEAMTAYTAAEARGDHLEAGNKLNEAQAHFTKASRAKQELMAIAQGGKGDVRDTAEKVYNSLGTSSHGQALSNWEGEVAGADGRTNAQVAGTWARSRQPSESELAGSGSGSGGSSTPPSGTS